MGVWIEMSIIAPKDPLNIVTPCMGVWIEIQYVISLFVKSVSLPVWECGLKYPALKKMSKKQTVTPCMGVWIEITNL